MPTPESARSSGSHPGDAQTDVQPADRLETVDFDDDLTREIAEALIERLDGDEILFLPSRRLTDDVDASVKEIGYRIRDAATAAGLDIEHWGANSKGQTWKLEPDEESDLVTDGGTEVEQASDHSITRFEGVFNVEMPEEGPLFLRFAVHDSRDTFVRVDQDLTITGAFPFSTVLKSGYCERELDEESLGNLCDRWDYSVVDRAEYEAALTEEMHEHTREQAQKEDQARAWYNEGEN